MTYVFMIKKHWIDLHKIILTSLMFGTFHNLDRIGMNLGLTQFGRNYVTKRYSWVTRRAPYHIVRRYMYLYFYRGMGCGKLNTLAHDETQHLLADVIVVIDIC